MTSESFPPLVNDLLLRAAKGEQTERTPVWIMRQAGRYLPEFREERLKNDFFTICRTPQLAMKVTLQPIDRYDDLLDASIIFSDILVVPQALGLEVQMVPGKGPHFPQPLQNPEDMSRLLQNVNVDNSLGYVYDAIRQTRHALCGRVPLYGFIGAPWTLMAYMIEGGGSKTLSRAKTWLYRWPEASHELLQRITDISVEFLVGQARAGAQILQVFDSWGGELAPHIFKVFALPYIQQISKRVKEALADKAVPMTIFAKGAWYALPDLGKSGYEVVGLDWTIDPRWAREQVGWDVTLQGNLDPSTLFGDEECIRKETRRMVEAFSCDRRYIVNLGHGVYPDHDPEAIRTFIQAVKEFSSELSSNKK